MVFGDNLIAEIGITYLIDSGGKSRWWARCSNIYIYIFNKIARIELVNHYIVESYEYEWNGARVQLMVTGGCLPVCGGERLAWKSNGGCCGCGQV